ncbi:hypothetical protein GUITHDRAFT_155207 [Guillardia theta CCMP2712]|uniref:Uncharacterized protein n=2 Tax=Guillardia theta TaxID=55529 RepID=L1IKF3_GUITC|nr:hypothetical protein GUITHDRAFT_155207 [Guillardia theta CCMP2712]EKX36602.1 hypothetical protein GUITHDRAFT_155207 [Guillardia theta CCMP2712]|mmetsp:Transcript_32617/g.103280  ORF Transcript_32617/g.103280 Transcript_32617/m.103280 type:complete len:122 (+) Transcript_32617:220-585(+)|eukprot:XP_005823582.1 hypothetical protein GUITHDRAFT_155207 [Guillardia theta CCMP2712]
MPLNVIQGNSSQSPQSHEKRSSPMETTSHQPGVEDAPCTPPASPRKLVQAYDEKNVPKAPMRQRRIALPIPLEKKRKLTQDMIGDDDILLPPIEGKASMPARINVEDAIEMILRGKFRRLV